MRFRTPRRWYLRDPGRGQTLDVVAEPLSRLWARATARRLARATPFAPGVPVICVGNLTLGGSGKTPVARAIVSRLRSRGVDAQLLTRGHGGRLVGPVRADPRVHTAADIGDEPLMMAAEFPVWVARDRVAGARAAVRAGAKALVMDDGHQNGSLAKALSLVVVDGETRSGEWPFGNGKVFPAGPMREPLAAGLARADAAVVLLPADLETPDSGLASALAGRLVLSARLLPVSPPPAGRQLAFAGIGKPWKFERALRATGCELVNFQPLADHQPLTESLLAGLARQAEGLRADLLTTEKDWTRLPPAWRTRIAAWRMRAVFDDEAAFEALLRSRAGI